MNENDDLTQNPNQQNDNQTPPPQPIPQAQQVPPVTVPSTLEPDQSIVNGNVYQEARYNTPQSPAPVGMFRGMFDRRIGRLGYILGFVYVYVPLILLFALIFILIPLLGGGGFGERNLATTLINIATYLFGMAFIILLFPVIFSLYIRRLHDLNRPGIWILLGFVPIVSLFFALYLLFAPGDKQANQYGERVSSHDFLTVLGFKRP